MAWESGADSAEEPGAKCTEEIGSCTEGHKSREGLIRGSRIMYI